MNPNDILPDVGEWRFEYKYRLLPQQYHQIQAAIRPFVQPDVFTDSTPHHRYLVRSLYFDSADLRAYQEKIYGDCDRTKLRIRSYTDKLHNTALLRVEMKARKDITVEKRSTFIPMDVYTEFLRSGHWHSENDAVLIEFERYVHLKHLLPLILVEYHREGFTAKLQKDLRITFDHHVRSASAASLFPSKPFFRTHQLGAVIFEIKCSKSQPPWLLTLIRTHGLRVAANSKFAQGIEISRPEIIHPAWSY